MRGRSWPFGAAALVAAGLIVLVGGARPADSLEHRSDSDGPGGTSALLQYAQALGHPARPWTGPYRADQETGLLFVFTPTSAVTQADLAALETWLHRGGVLVYADESGRTGIDEAFQLRRSPTPGSAGKGAGSGPLLPGVNRVSGALAALPFLPGAGQVVLLRNQQGSALAVMEQVGAGLVVALGDPQEVVNAHIDRDDNWRLAADLLALAAPGSPVGFDEYHHGAGVTSTSPYAVFAFGWAQGLLAAAAVLFFGLALRGRAFGPRLPIAEDRGRPASEYVNAVGTLLARARARRLTLDVLLASTRRRLRERAGIARGGQAGDLALEQRAPELAGRLAELEAGVEGADVSDARLLEIARRLHELGESSPSPSPSPLRGG